MPNRIEPTGRMTKPTPKTGKSLEQRYGLVLAGEKKLRHRRGEIAVDAEVVPLELVADRAGDNRFAIFGAHCRGKRSYCHATRSPRRRSSAAESLAYPSSSQPMRRIRSGCCAHAGSAHAVAPSPSNMARSRCLMAAPVLMKSLPLHEQLISTASAHTP